MAGPVSIANGIDWVGALDPDLRVFDLVMRTEHGTTYNSYLVQGEEKVALVDCVKAGFEGQLFAAVEARVPLDRLDYIIVNHTEPDHAGAIGAVLERAPNATVVGTKRALNFVRQMLNRDFPSLLVKAGSTLDLGGRTLRFVPAPFLHWPDTMFTWLEEDRVLFSCDVFGAHYCHEGIFDDALDADLLPATRYYYDTIMGPFAKHVRLGLKKISGFDPAVICASHGPVLRANPKRYYELYAEWSAAPERPTVAVCFASIYGYTRKLADEFIAGLEEAGANVSVHDLGAEPMADAVAACWAASAVVVGTPTLNGGVAPQIADLMAHIDMHRGNGKLFAAFGSYGWSGEAVDILNARAREVRMRPLGDGLKVEFLPTDEQLAEARAYGARIADAVTEMA